MAGTEAAFPAAFGQTAGGAVMAAEGVGFTVTIAEPEEVPEQLVASRIDDTE